MVDTVAPGRAPARPDGASGGDDAPRPRVVLVFAIAVACVACAVATALLVTAGATITHSLIPVGLLAGAGLVALGCYRFEWFVLVSIALRSALDITKLEPGKQLGSGAAAAPKAVSSGPAASAMAVLFIVMSLTWLLAQYRGGPRNRLTYAEAAFAVFVSSCLLSVLGAVDRVAAITETARILAAVLMFFVLIRLLTSWQRVWRLLIAGAIGYLAPVALGLLQAAGHGVEFHNAGLSRVVGTFLHPNLYALFLAIYVLMGIAIYRHCEPRIRLLLVVSVTVCLALLVLTYSRGAWVALLAGLIMIGVLQSRRILWWTLGAVVVAGAALPSVLARVSNLTAGDTPTGGAGNSFLWRVQYWQEIWQLNHNNPLTGVGLKGTKYLSDAHKAPHNDYLRAYVETGILGLVAFLVLLIALAALARRAVRTAPAGMPRGVAVGFAAILIAYALDSFSENLMSAVVILWYVYAAAAAAYACGRLSSSSQREPARSQAGSEPTAADGARAP